MVCSASQINPKTAIKLSVILSSYMNFVLYCCRPDYSAVDHAGKAHFPGGHNWLGAF